MEARARANLRTVPTTRRSRSGKTTQGLRTLRPEAHRPPAIAVDEPNG